MNHKILDRKKHTVCLAGVILLVLLTGLFLFKDRDITAIPQALAGANPYYMLAGIGAIAAFFALEARGIQILLQPLAGGMGYMQTYKYALIDFYFSSITPGCSGGQPSQAFFMYKDNIPLSASSLALLTFNMVYHFAIILFAVAIAIWAPGDILSGIGAFKILLVYGLTIQFLLIILYLLAIFNRKLICRIIYCLAAFLTKIRLVKDPEKFRAKAALQIDAYCQGACYIKNHPLLLLRTIVIVLLHLLMLYSVPYWIYRALGLSGISFMEMITIQAALTICIESLPIPGGIGVAEGGFFLIYTKIFGEGLLLPALLLCRGLNYYLGLLAGGAVSAISFSRTQQQNKTEATG